MPLTKEHNDHGAEWFGHDLAYSQPMPVTLWDGRHKALESDFADNATAWVTKKDKLHDWLAAPLESDGVSEKQMLCLVKHYSQSIEFSHPEIRLRAEGLRVEFEALAKNWHRDTRHLSQISKQITHPAFLRIIGMGEPALPLILEALRKKPAHWFTALRAIANTDPAQIDDNPSQARAAWIAWGQRRGYID